jgi:hypothetical protein
VARSGTVTTAILHGRSLAGRPAELDWSRASSAPVESPGGDCNNTRELEAEEIPGGTSEVALCSVLYSSLELLASALVTVTAAAN